MGNRLERHECLVCGAPLIEDGSNPLFCNNCIPGLEAKGSLVVENSKSDTRKKGKVLRVRIPGIEGPLRKPPKWVDNETN